MADETSPTGDVDLDALLSIGTEPKAPKSEPVPAAVVAPPAPVEPIAPPEAKKPEPTKVIGPATAKPAPAAPPAAESELTPDQKRIRELEHKLALQETAKLDHQVDEEIVAEGQSVVIHIVHDGFSAQGRIWYRGQELEFDSRTVQETRDRFGWSWLSLMDDEQAQYAYYGRLWFKRGPWPGAAWDDEAAAAAEKARRRAVPVPTRG